MTIQTASKSQALIQNMPLRLEHAEGPLSGPVQLHPALEEVRRLKEFQPPEPNPLEHWLEQPFFKNLSQKINQAFSHMTEALARFLHQLHLPGAGHLPENIRDFFSGFVGFIAVLMGLFAFYVLLGIFLRWTEQKYLTGKPEPRFFEKTLLVNAEHHRQQAQYSANQGHYTEGIRQWYLALLCFLDESRLVPFSSTRSNREYSALLTQVSIQSHFEHLARQFESIHYGNFEGNARQCEQCETWYTQLTRDYQPHA